MSPVQEMKPLETGRWPEKSLAPEFFPNFPGGNPPREKADKQEPQADDAAELKNGIIFCGHRIGQSAIFSYFPNAVKKIDGAASSKGFNR
jgi:hypothetical protein